jgi:hypothetical protein
MDQRPSGKGVDDFYGPEINSTPVALPFAGCNPVPFPDPTPDDGWTTSFSNIQCYDLTHVQAVLNQINGFTHDRSRKSGVPAVFGTNFQSVSVGQKLKHDPVSGASGRLHRRSRHAWSRPFFRARVHRRVARQTSSLSSKSKASTIQR